MNTVYQIEVDKNCRRDLLTTSTEIRQEYRINALHMHVDKIHQRARTRL